VSLVQLIYISSARTTPVSRETLDDIMSASSRNNARDGITGMLLYAEGTFMQVLEGEAAAVEATHHRIERDARHAGIFVLEHGPISERSFAQWSMGFREVGAAEFAEHPGFAPFFSVGFDPQKIGAKAGTALSMLQHFGVNQRAIRSR
jgi:hypothetical protein